MLLRDFEQAQSRTVRLPLSLLPRPNGLRAYVERCRKDRLRKLHLVTDLANSTGAILGRGLDLCLGYGIPSDPSRFDLTSLDSGGLTSRGE